MRMYVCVYIRLYYTSVIPSGYGMVQCDNQWFGIPPINGHPAFQRESVTPLQQPSLMLGCLVTSHSRKSASAGKRIPCSPSSRHWAVFDWPFQFHILTPSKERPIDLYIFIIPTQLLLILICGWATQQKNESHLGWRSHFHGIKNHCEHVSHTQDNFETLGIIADAHYRDLQTNRKIPSGNLTWLLKIAIYSESSHYCHWWIFP